MAYQAIQSSPLTGAIYVGPLNRDGTAFLRKEDRTDDILLAVAQFVQQNFNGGMEMTFRSTTGGADLRLNVTVTQTAPGKPKEST